MRKRLCGICSSGAFLLLSAYVLYTEGGVDMNAVNKAIMLGTLGALCCGVLGYYIGKVIEAPPKAKQEATEDDFQNTDDDLLIDDIMIDDIKGMGDIEF